MTDWPRRLILLCTLIEAGWMAFVGIDPRGTTMKVIFAVYGWTWLLIGVAFAFSVCGSWAAMLAAALGALWFLPLGTVLSAAQVALLLIGRNRLL